MLCMRCGTEQQEPGSIHCGFCIAYMKATNPTPPPPTICSMCGKPGVKVGEIRCAPCEQLIQSAGGCISTGTVGTNPGIRTTVSSRNFPPPPDPQDFADGIKKASQGVASNGYIFDWNTQTIKPIEREQPKVEKPIHEMTLEDYRRGVRNMGMARWG